MNFEIRKVHPDDAAQMLAFARTVGGETDLLAYGPEGIGCTLDQEREILADFAEGENQVMFVAIVDGELAGSLGFQAGHRERISHVGEMGMAVRRDCWGMGIGSALVDALLEWGRDHDTIQKINLRVRTDNERAQALYRKKGFQVEGTITRDIKVGDTYYDQILMGIFLE